ncbi:hypothetical protein Tco_1576572 [Tanacetum coccineum]
MQELKISLPEEKLRKSCDIKLLTSFFSPEWSRFVTAAKQTKNLHVVNFNQSYGYLKQNENDANEVQTMRQRFPDPLSLLANTYNPPPSYITQRS